MSQRTTAPESHELRVAKDTLRMTPSMVPMMGGPSIDEAWQTVYRLTGRWPTEREVHPATWVEQNQSQGMSFAESNQSLIDDGIVEF